VKFAAAVLLLLVACSHSVEAPQRGLYGKARRKPSPTANPVPTTGTPPSSAGYFSTLAPNAALPDSATCRSSVHRSTWEPRPENAKYNGTIPSKASIDASFKARPRGAEWLNWDSYLLPRLDGNMTGTTDEILQWAACKWGLSDNLVRVIAATESTWYQYATYSTGQCVTNFGCGDFWASDPTYCIALAGFGYDYQRDYGAGVCPGTFSIAGVMSYQRPDWGPMRDNQNGAFPFNRDSTAFAAEYMASTIRGCYNGWEKWLRTPFPSYQAGDLWGCVGVWYSGEWHTARAEQYITNVRSNLDNRVWLKSTWAQRQYA
jgi:hypothetical protein